MLDDYCECAHRQHGTRSAASEICKNLVKTLKLIAMHPGSCKLGSCMMHVRMRWKLEHITWCQLNMMGNSHVG